MLWRGLSLRLIATVATAVLVVPTFAGIRVTARVAEVLAAPQGNGDGPPLAPWATRARYMAVDTDALPTPSTLRIADLEATRLRLDLFDDLSVVATFDRFAPNRTGTSWVGVVDGEPDSSVTLVYAAGLLTGTVALRDRVFSIRPASVDARQAQPVAAGVLHVVSEVDQASFGQEHAPIVVDAPSAGPGLGDGPMNDAGDVIDLMVVYTAAARAAAGGTAGIENLINLGVAETNTSYTNSQVVQQLRLVHTAEVPYAESGSLSTDLPNLRSSVGGLSGVAALRNTYGADMVMLVTNSPDGCGIGYLMSSVGAYFEAYAFNVVEYDCISPNYTFAHELGHNMGLRHDWFVDSATTPYSYAHGHVNTTAGNRFRTIMSYNDLCSSQGFSCTRRLNWSNPAVAFGGAPMGIAGGTNTSCSTGVPSSNTCDADDHRALNDTAFTVANFRQAIVPAPGSFGKTAPIDGTAGVNGSTTLSWSASSNATSYEYCVDTTNDSTCAGSWTSVGSALSAGLGGLAPNAAYYWQVRAVNGFGVAMADNAAWWAIGTLGYTGALYSSTFGVPTCTFVVTVCDTGALILGRGVMAGGVEPHEPNTINDSCGDGSAGQFHIDESIDRIRVLTPTGQPFAATRPVTVEVTAWITNVAQDAIDIYAAPDAASPSWIFAGTVTPTSTGQQVLSLTYNLPLGSVQAVRARLRWQGPFGPCGTSPFDDHDDVVFAVGPVPDADVIQNGTFAAGLTNWNTFATPDMSYIVANAAGGSMNFYRNAPPVGTSNQAVVFQSTGTAIGPNAALVARFALGNTDTVRKRISVLVHDADFGDLAVCTFWLAPSSPLLLHQMDVHTTKPWTNATISFYAASANAAGNTSGFYQVDNVQLQYAAAGSALHQSCAGPGIPAPPGGADGPNLLVNGTFGTGSLAPWGTFGQISGAVTGGVFEFVRTPGTPAGVLLQSTGAAMTTNTIFTASFQLGNSSSVRKRVTTILHDADFTDFTACTFWLAPGQPLGTFTHRAFATQAWANATLSIYPSTIGTEPWIRLDNVELRRTPGHPTASTYCVEPGGVVP